VEDYDEFFHARVNKHLTVLQKCLAYAYVGATLAEADTWPEPVWGKKTDFGLLNVLHRTLGKYQANFFNRLGGEEALKKLKSTDEWFSEMRKVNNQLANDAADNRAKKSKIAAVVELDKIVSEVEMKRNGPMVVMTKDGPRDTRLPMTPYPRSGSYDPSSRQSRPNAPDLSRRPQSMYEHNRFRSNPTQVRSAAMESEYENLLDETIDGDNPMYGDTLDELRRQAQEQEDEDWIWGNSGEDSTANLDAVGPYSKPAAGGGPSGPRVLFDPKSKGRDPNKPCFRQFEKKDCPGNCGWNHSQEAMHQVMKDRVRILLESPYVPMEYLETEIAKHKRNRSMARNAALTQTFETWEEDQETSGLAGLSHLEVTNNLEFAQLRSEPNSPAPIPSRPRISSGPVVHSPQPVNRPSSSS